MIRVVFGFELSRAARNGSVPVLAAIVLFAALALAFTLGPNLFPSGMSMSKWYTSAIPTVWYWVGFPICAAFVSAQIGGSDVASGSLRLVLTTPGARRALVFGKLAAIAVALLAMSAMVAAVVLLAVVISGINGSVSEVPTVSLRLVIRMISGLYGGLVWAAFVYWLSIRFSGHLRAGSSAALIIVAGWTLRGQMGARVEPYLIPFWGGAMLEQPLLMFVPVTLCLAIAVALTIVAMRRLEVR